MKTEIVPRTSHYPFLRLFLLSLACAVIVYYPGFGGGFLYDDYNTIVSIPQVQITALSFESLNAAAWSFEHSVLHRPLSMLSFGLNHFLFGMSPAAFKAVNLLLHLVTGIGIYLLCALLVRALRTGTGTSPPAWLPVAIAGAWLLNPVNLTTVLYIVQRMTGLASLFMVAGMLLYTWGRMRQLRGQTGLIPISVVILFILPLAIFSKENGILLMPYLLAIELVFFRFRAPDGTRNRWLMLLFLSLCVLPAIAALGYLFSPYSTLLNGYNIRDFSLSERLMTEARALWFYIRLILLPDNRLLGIFHDDFPVSTGLLSPPSTALAIAALTALLAAAVISIRRLPLFSFGILLFFISHGIESTFLPLELVHEHRNYLASFGLLTALFGLLGQLAPGISTNRLAVAGLCAYLALLGVTTGFRALSWGNRIGHAIDEARHHPESPRANFYAGSTYLSVANASRRDIIEQGIAHLEKTRKLDPYNITAEVSLIIESQRLSIPLDENWLRDARNKFEASIITPSSLFSLRALYLCQKDGPCHIPHAKVIPLFEIAVKKKRLLAYIFLGAYRENILGDLEGAQKLYESAIHQAPDKPSYYLALANVLQKQGKWEAAIKELEIAETKDRLGVHSQKIKLLRSIDEQRNASKQPDASGGNNQ